MTCARLAHFERPDQAESLPHLISRECTHGRRLGYFWRFGTETPGAGSGADAVSAAAALVAIGDPRAPPILALLLQMAPAGVDRHRRARLPRDT